MLITSEKSFKLITWKLWEELITQTCYPILKPYLKLATQYWSLTWKLSKSKMKLFCQKLFFRLQKFTCISSMYPQQVCMVSKWSIENCKRSWLHKLHTLQCKQLPNMTKNCLSPKCHNFVKNYFFGCKNSHAHLQCIHNKYAWFQNDPLKTVRGVDYTNSIPYNAKSWLKWLSSKGCNSVKINSSST